MRGDILARIPEDNGKVLRYGGGSITVESQKCDDCELPAAVIMQGETDSMGFEPIVLCDTCRGKCDAVSANYLNALDVEDRAPKEGHIFLVSECTNYDGHGSWCRTFNSFRLATAYYRKIQQKAEPWMGLYPNNRVQEVPEKTGRRIKADDMHRKTEEALEYEEWMKRRGTEG